MFNGEWRESLTGCYHLGNGYRLFSPGLMRFQSPDSLCPFGEGALTHMPTVQVIRSIRPTRPGISAPR
ncbi:hypothetical protein [Pseudomonas xanthosomatis]|uniref:hypothetical protein n=1 Tax=Pseudomonas xanthosomatis TaxID=2842356 RepID=UPI0021F19E2A|nr:hypothetical protein [Pseudomonas xanthosomatis]